ncbi:exopolysaccharide biosynthesis protein [Devosia submarina]|uniref:exopolysaccharide biosynthesis protein n=1 Tax=Devosia submarina TaxID=1173082 RepID=UPI0013008F02|nr:exopolysaccharide biosynthesis protein [Devosia submarina]
MNDQPTISDLLEQISSRVEQDQSLSIGTIEAVAGRRIAGPMLFFPAMLVVSPLSLVPTLPTFVAVLTILVAGQIVLGRKTIWLPQKIRSAKLSGERAAKALGFIKPAGRLLDRISRPRLTMLTADPGQRLVALICILVALTMPPMELVPGASTTAGSVLAALGLSLTTRDGALLLLALGVMAAGAGMLAYLVTKWLGM